MSQIPNPVFLFHFTALPNLESMLTTSCLKSKNRLHRDGIKSVNIAYDNIQDKRARTITSDATGRTLHDYVPFHFAPRSPMLYTITRGNVTEAEETNQDNLIYLVTEVSRLADLDFVFTDYHPLPAYASFYNDLSDLNKINWELFFEIPVIPDTPPFPGYCKYWQNRDKELKYVKRKETREAEFLVCPEVPIDRIIMIGVRTPEMKTKVEKLLHDHGLSIRIEVKPGWYFE